MKILKCNKHSKYHFINSGGDNVIIRSDQFQLKIISKLKKYLNKEFSNKIKCRECYDFVIDTLNYLNQLKDNYFKDDNKKKVAQLIYAVTLTKCRKHIQKRERFR